VRRGADAEGGAPGGRTGGRGDRAQPCAARGAGARRDGGTRDAHERKALREAEAREAATPPWLTHRVRPSHLLSRRHAPQEVPVSLRVRALVLLSFLLAPASSLASDGVVEINQARMAAGDVTPGDAPGAPVTISAPGSYRLTSNLRGLDRTKAVVLIASDRVSLDLNGFTVGFCLDVTLPQICLQGSEPAIGVDEDRDQVAVRNGVVVGGGNDGVWLRLTTSSVVENVRVTGSLDGITVGPGSLVRNSVTEGNVRGLSIAAGTLVESTVIRGNSTSAILMQFGPNGQTGIRGCAITQNGTPAVEVQPMNANVRDLGGNLCGSDTVCP
jgi:hypothetical protein